MKKNIFHFVCVVRTHTYSLHTEINSFVGETNMYKFQNKSQLRRLTQNFSHHFRVGFGKRCALVILFLAMFFFFRLDNMLRGCWKDIICLNSRSNTCQNKHKHSSLLSFNQAEWENNSNLIQFTEILNAFWSLEIHIYIQKMCMCVCVCARYRNGSTNWNKHASNCVCYCFPFFSFGTFLN